ncbi:MAG: extracellular solute-binding protein [FCB group bacterium]|nr:extracellular solute-binding protein [FCB group bacterium]
MTIRYWQFWTDAAIKPVIEEIVGDFERSHPGVKVELADLTWADGHDKIAIAFSAGSGPDIVELGSDWIAEFSSSGHLADITEAVLDVHNDYLMWDPAVFNEKIYAFPWILGTRVLYANTDLLTKAGMDADYEPLNWDDFLVASRMINALDDNIFGFGSNSAERHRLYKKFLPFLWANGGRILSDDGRNCLLDLPEASGALGFYLELCKTGLTDTQRRLEDAFLEGRIGFVISGDWLLKRMARERPEMAFSTMIIPGVDGMYSSTSFAGGEYLAINAKSEHPQIALELIRHICSAKNQLRFCLQNRTANPASKKAAADATFMAQPHFETFVEQMKTAKMPPVHPRWVYIEDRLEKAIEAALYETMSPRQALDDAAAKIEELLKE